MSAFMVSDQTIDRVCAGIAAMKPRGIDIAGVYIAPATFAPTEREQNLTQLGQALIALNAAAVNARYGDGEAEDDSENYKFNGYIVSDVYCVGNAKLTEYYKAMSCFLYQCNEGNIDQTETYKKVREVARDLAELIAMKTPQYETAAWG